MPIFILVRQLVLLVCINSALIMSPPARTINKIPLNKFLGQRRSKVRVQFGVPFRSGDRPSLTPLCLTARDKYYTTFLVAAKM